MLANLMLQILKFKAINICESIWFLKSISFEGSSFMLKLAPWYTVIGRLRGKNLEWINEGQGRELKRRRWTHRVEQIFNPLLKQSHDEINVFTQLRHIILFFVQACSIYSCRFSLHCTIFSQVWKLFYS